jgi:hypothetical protein
MPIIMLAGPIKHWWNENWQTKDHLAYDDWRRRVNDALVARNYLVYRPHEAFKGAWDERAQSVNDMVLRSADVILNLTPPGVPSLGTDAEMLYASNFDSIIIDAPPTSDYDSGIRELMIKIEQLVPPMDGMEQDVIKATLVMVPTNHWMLSSFIDHHQGSPFRVHYYDELGHVQAKDVATIDPGTGQDLVILNRTESEVFHLPRERMLKLEVLETNN